MKLKKIISLVIGLSIVFIGVCLTNTYRIYIYSNNLYDYHLADTIGSLICVPASVFVFYSITNKKSIYFFIINSTIGFILYEILSLSKIHGTFDLYDIVAIIVGAVFTYLSIKIFYVIRKKYRFKRYGL